MPDAPEALLTERLQAEFEAAGCHALFGKTQGYYGPYIWRDTVPTAYQVELPDGTAAYTVNILRGFIFRSWMDYLTFGRYGTGGWASPDGMINCIEQAYDFESERFLVSLLKHEARACRQVVDAWKDRRSLCQRSIQVCEITACPVLAGRLH